MEAWRAHLAAAREFYEEDDEDDQLMIHLVLGFGVEEDVEMPRVWGASCLGKASNIERYRHEMHKRMMLDYFCDTPVYGPGLFRRRYRMWRSLLLTIMERVTSCDSYFVQKKDVCGSLGLSPHQKITAALRMLCYGICADAIDEYCRTSETTAMKSLKRFCSTT